MTCSAAFLLSSSRPVWWATYRPTDGPYDLFPGGSMTARASESLSTCLADWSILVIGNSMPPRDPNDDDDDGDDDDEDGDIEPDEDEPAVIREPDE
jgi:hypothetical protein